MTDGWGGRADVHGRPAGPATDGATMGDITSSDSREWRRSVDELLPEAERYERAAAGEADVVQRRWMERRASQLRDEYNRREDQRISRLVQEAYPRFFSQFLGWLTDCEAD